MYKYIKSFFDVTLAVFVVLLLLILLLPLMFILRLTGEGEVFYLQERIGLNNEPFQIIKFATMLKDSPNMMGGGFVEANDTRLLPLGAFLRKTKINELPQLINVLRGDMSLVGFRPLAKASYDTTVGIGGSSTYTVLPGITSLASILLRNEEEILADVSACERQYFYDTKILPKKVAMDRWWKDNKSFYNYLALIFLTALALFLPYQLLPLKLLTNLPLEALVLDIERKGAA